MSKKSSYSYKFTNGTITISRGITTKFDWKLSVDLTPNNKGDKRFIGLDQSIFLTRKAAKEYALGLLGKYKLL